MEIRDRIFPYPILNNNKILSNYGEINFTFSYDREDTDDEVIFKNARVETDSKLIEQLSNENKIKMYCIVECSYTVYRKAFEISRLPRDIHLFKKDLTGKVSISIYAVASQDFILNSYEFEEDYRNINFEIEKYNILAAYDGFTIDFWHEEKADDLKQSIFSIIIDHVMEPGSPYSVGCNSKKIEISLSEQEYNNYRIVYENSNYKDIFFNLLLVPALNQGLTECKMYLMSNDSYDFEDVSREFLWFRTILNAYKRLNNVDLTEEDFKKSSTINMAQELLGKPFSNALKELIVLSNGKIEEDDN